MNQIAIIVSISLILLLLSSSCNKVNAQPGGGTTCSGNVQQFSNPTAQTCIQAMSSGNDYKYPDDFCGLTTFFEEYECPTSKTRVIRSNNIPNHNIRVGNPNAPCEIPFHISLPLNPSKQSSVTEPPPLGILAIAMNGVAIYGAQEGGGTNAAEPEPGAQITDAQYWYGHAAMSGDWHYHSSLSGFEKMPSSTTKMGYAMDGFPIYGALDDPSVLDECNGREVNGTYQYHVRTLDQVDGAGSYCDGTKAAITWKYHIGCYHGDISTTTVGSRLTTALPSDCVKVASIGSDNLSSSCSISTIGYIGIAIGAIVGALLLGFFFYKVLKMKKSGAAKDNNKETELSTV
jgi:hypothetical protein